MTWVRSHGVCSHELFHGGMESAHELFHSHGVCSHELFHSHGVCSHELFHSHGVCSHELFHSRGVCSHELFHGGMESALMSCFIAEFSLVPRLSRNANMYRSESLVSFLHKHDVIKIGPKQKGNVLHVIQPTMLQRSVCMLFNTR